MAQPAMPPIAAPIRNRILKNPRVSASLEMVRRF
jgi:hypothetical protein